MNKRTLSISWMLFALCASSCAVGRQEASSSSSSGETGTSEASSQGGQSSASSSPAGTEESSTSSSLGTALPHINHLKVLTTGYTHIYAWEEAQGKVTEHLGKWPGTELKRYDEAWMTFDFPEGMTATNLIFSDGGANQTADLRVEGIGYHWFNGTKWSHSSIYGGDFSSEGGGSGGGENQGGNLDPQKPFDPIEANSHLDFPMWTEMDPAHFTVLHPYRGARTDFRDETIYFAITTRFYDGDPSNNMECWDGRNPSYDPAWRGDFKGLIDKLDYIKALGFTSVWITPVVENTSGYDYHGYHASNFSKVDERYLSQDVSLETLIEELHDRDMKLILDVVFNHTGNFGERNLFPMFEKSGDLSSIDCLKVLPNSGLPANYDSLSGGEQYDARIAAMKNTRNDGSDPNDIYHHHGNFSWESFGEQVAQIAGDCVDLNTENPIVAEYLVKCYGEFIRMGVDYFRIDTTKHISRLTWNNYLLPGLYEYARRCGNPHFYMFGEVCTRVREVWNHNIPALSAPFYTWKEQKQYPWGDKKTNYASIEAAYEDNKSVDDEPTSNNAFLDGMQYHAPDHSCHSGMSVIDFPMHWNFGNAQDAFRVGVGNDRFYNDATYNVTYVDSHDYGPDEIQRVRFNKGELAWAENMNLMFTFRGVPCLYYGSEIEFQSGCVIDNGPNTPLEETGRAYFGDHLEGRVTASDFGVYAAEGEVASTLDAPLAKHLRKLNAIRAAVPALRKGQYTQEGVRGEMAFARRYVQGDLDSFCCVAVSGGASFSGIPNGTYVDLVSGRRVDVSGNYLGTDSIGKGNLRVYVLENASTGPLGQIGDSLRYLR